DDNGNGPNWASFKPPRTFDDASWRRHDPYVGSHVRRVLPSLAGTHIRVGSRQLSVSTGALSGRKHPRERSGVTALADYSLQTCATRPGGSRATFVLQKIRKTRELHVQSAPDEILSAQKPFAVESGHDRRSACGGDGDELLIVNVEIT